MKIVGFEANNKVRLGVVDGDSVITSGLTGGEEVVTAGHLMLSEGTKVAVREAKTGS